MWNLKKKNPQMDKQNSNRFIDTDQRGEGWGAEQNR